MLWFRHTNNCKCIALNNTNNTRCANKKKFITDYCLKHIKLIVSKRSIKIVGGGIKTITNEELEILTKLI